MEEKSISGASVIYGLLKDNGVIIKEKSSIGELIGRGYGKLYDNDFLILNEYETLYLVETNRLIVKTSSEESISFNELLRIFQSKNPRLWILYVIYRDLRRRGYVVKEGFGNDLVFRIYEKGKDVESYYVIYPFFEGTPEKMANMLEAARQTLSKDKQLIVAVVERRGEVIYYTCSEVDLRNV